MNFTEFNIAAVIPAYGVERDIRSVLGGLPAYIKYIIVVDDASPDSTAELVTGAAHNDGRITLIRHMENQGVGGAMISGFRKAIELGAQIVAAVIGAIFVIGLQMATIVSYGTISQIAFLKSETLVAIVPAFESPAWLPARAILGDTQALLAVLAAAFTMLGASIVIFSARFGEHAIAAAGVSEGRPGQRGRYRTFRTASPKQMLRRKEWTLLIRDLWLASQTLMQLLYLLPPR
jgi:hypothetical protein